LGSEEGRRRREKKKEKEILRRGKWPVETRRRRELDVTRRNGEEGEYIIRL
jgi:hypothetical protein